MVEATFVEVHIDQRRVGDAGDAVILHPRGEDVAGFRIDFARFVELIAVALDHRACRLTAVERGRRDLSARDAGVNVQNPHTPKPRPNPHPPPPPHPRAPTPTPPL